MKWEQFNKLTPSNKAIQDLKELLIMTNFTDEELERFFTFRGKVTTGQKLGWIGEMEDVGWVGGGCNPKYRKVNIPAAEKEWKIGKWSIPLEFCYEDLENTIAEYCLKTGTDEADLTSTEYMDHIVFPALDLAIKRMFWRFAWFGDENAANIEDSGSITDGIDVDLFKTCDGFFKQLFTICTENVDQRITIAANAEATYALQRSKIRESGVAIKIFDDLFDNADSRIASMDGAGVFCTKSLVDALEKDLKREYKLILDWEQVFKGLDVTEYDGHLLYRISIWDRFIQKYQNNGTKLNMPHRAVFGSPKQLFVGSPADSIISDVNLWFNQDEEVNRIKSKGRLGCLVGEDNLFQLAY